jgi:hypothetical protein
MAWIKERTTDDVDKRFVACNRDPEGHRRSASHIQLAPGGRTCREP